MEARPAEKPATISMREEVARCVSWLITLMCITELFDVVAFVDPSMSGRIFLCGYDAAI